MAQILTPNQILKRIMKKEKLSYKQVSELCVVSLPTVHSWLVPETSKCKRKMPTRSLDLLVLRLRQKILDNPKIIY